MKTSKWAILTIILCTFLTSGAQLFLKLGANRLELSLIALVTNWQLILGLFFYAITFLTMIIALKYGELSVLFPFLSLSFVWVPILSIYVLGETITATNWLGAVFIIGGVSFIGRGAE